MTALIGIGSFAALWIGTLIYSTGKQNRFNDEIRRDIDDMRDQVRELRKWGEAQVSERIAYNQLHYVDATMCNVHHKELVRRLEVIEGYNINVKLATIESQLAQVITTLEEIKKRG